MNCCDFEVSSGKCRIILPVFTDSEAGGRMNRFYSAAAGIIYAYGEEFTREKFAAFSCCPCVVEDGGTVAVSLNFTYSRRGERRVRRTVTHLWKDGYIRKKEIT